MKDKIDTYKRNLILETATKHFQELGYDKTQINAIAKELGIGNSTIYKFFKSKEELFYEYLKSLCQMALEEFTIRFSTVKNPEEKIKVFVRRKFNYFEENKSYMRSYFIEAPHIIQKFGSNEEDPYFGIIKLLAEAFEQMAETKKLITDDYIQLAYSIDFLSDSYLKRWIQKEFDIETKADEVINAFFNGIFD